MARILPSAQNLLLSKDAYLSDSGYTLTVAMNLDDGRLAGFASNDKEWVPVWGTLEVVK